MFRRYQVRIRRYDDLHAFAVRMNASRESPRDPKAERYRLALNLLVAQGQFDAARNASAASLKAVAEQR